MGGCDWDVSTVPRTRLPTHHTPGVGWFGRIGAAERDPQRWAEVLQRGAARCSEFGRRPADWPDGAAGSLYFAFLPSLLSLPPLGISCISGRRWEQNRPIADGCTQALCFTCTDIPGQD